jgi:hypothetical protein
MTTTLSAANDDRGRQLIKKQNKKNKIEKPGFVFIFPPLLPENYDDLPLFSYLSCICDNRITAWAGGGNAD